MRKNKDNSVPLFSVLGFRPKERRFKGKNKDESYYLPFKPEEFIGIEPRVLEISIKLCGCGSNDGNISIDIEEATIFSSYMGEPIDDNERTMWNNLNQKEKEKHVNKTILKSGIKSFTKILWGFFLLLTYTNSKSKNNNSEK